MVVEEIRADGPAILMVRGMSHRFGNRIRSHHDIGFALTKVVRNRTERAWSQFDLELREFLDHASPFGDGLSFGQASEAGRPFAADRFDDSLETSEPFDAVPFFDADVGADETVVLNVVITDTTPRCQFYLLQKRDSPLASSPDLPGRGAPAAGPATLVSALLAPPAVAHPQAAAPRPDD